MSVRRIQKFLELPELSPDSNDNKTDVQKDNVDENVALSLENVSCFWDFNIRDNSSPIVSDDEANVPNGVLALDNISIDLRMNELTCVIGPVGSGKSAFLYALAGELVAHQGTIQRNKLSLAFATQDPWIMNGSVKENILLGRPFDGDFYNDIIRSCGLDIDFEQFVDGDETIVGDRGVQCSGGQVSHIIISQS